MKAKIKYLFILFVFVIVLYIGYVNVTANEYISPERKIEETPQVWNPAITNSINSKDIGINIDGTEIVVKRGRIYMDESMSIMLPTDLITESFDCAINLYDNTLVIERGNTKIVMKIGNYDIFVNDKELMHFSYTRYIENQIRNAFGFKGTPLKFIIRERKDNQ